MTTATATTWGSGLGVSLAAHLAAGALLAVMLQPHPITDQPQPKSQLTIETQEVTRSQAKAEAPQATNAAATSPQGARLAEGQVPLSRAKAATVQPDHVAASTPEQTTTPATAPPDTKLAALAPPPPVKAVVADAPAAKAVVADAPALKAALSDTPAVKAALSAAPALKAVLSDAPALKAVLSDTPAVKAAVANAPILTATAADAPTLTAAAADAPFLQAAIAQVALQQATAADTPPVKPTEATPVAARPQDAATLTTALTSATLATPALAPVTPDAPAAVQSTPTAEPVAAAPSDGTHMTAALAWSGDKGTQIDAQSLKAIQSFMRPGDTAAASDDVHDGLSAILTSVPCSRLQAEFNPATGKLDLRGHVPDAAMRGPVLKALQDQLGTAIQVEDAMLILPSPQCGALSGISDVGLPQSQDQLTNPRLIGADAQAKAYTYTTGQTMVLDLAAPDYDAYLYVDFFDADGNVIHLVPNDTVPLKLRPAKTAIRVGASNAGEPFLNITIGPPYGQEIAAAFAASAPLYDGLRPLSEPAGPYLDWLKTKVAAARAKNPDFKGEWVYFFVSTRQK